MTSDEAFREFMKDTGGRDLYGASVRKIAFEKIWNWIRDRFGFEPGKKPA